MSQYHEVSDLFDIEIDWNAKEVDIYAGDNDFGSIYATLSFETILKLAGHIRDQSKASNPE